MNEQIADAPKTDKEVIQHLMGAVGFTAYEAPNNEREDKDYYIALARLMAKAGIDVREYNIAFLDLEDETLEYIHRQYADL